MPNPDPPEFPWYSLASGGGLEQGDILLECPRFAPAAAGPPNGDPVPGVEKTVSAVVLTQSCDLAVRPDGRCEAEDVLLCQIGFKHELTGHKVWGKDDAWEEVRKGRRTHFHVLNAAKLPGLDLDFMLVDFRQVFALPVELVRQFAAGAGDGPRLRPPYREHLSQSFARLSMRVGLPADIPPFARKKYPARKRRRGGRTAPAAGVGQTLAGGRH